MAMIDLGEKGECCAVSGPSNDVYYPTIYIDNSKDLPFDTDDVGETIKAEVVVKLTSLTTRNAGAGDKESYSFEVRKIDFMKTKEEEDYTRGRIKTKSLRS